MIVLCVAHVFGIANILGSEIPAWAIIVCGYFVGLVLEELSRIKEKVSRSRTKIENKVCSEEKYRNFDYDQCKAARMSHEKEIVADEPLAHIVMSRSFETAFTLILFFDLLDALFGNAWISDSFLSPFADIVLLPVLVLVFRSRANHYCKRRAENIFDYCIGNGYADIEKTPDMSQWTELSVSEQRRSAFPYTGDPGTVVK